MAVVVVLVAAAAAMKLDDEKNESGIYHQAQLEEKFLNSFCMAGVSTKRRCQNLHRRQIEKREKTVVHT